MSKATATARARPDKEREQAILDSLEKYGPQGTSDLRRTAGLGSISTQAFMVYIDALEQQGRLTFDQRGKGYPRMYRLPHQEPKPYERVPRGKRLPQSRIGLEVPSELIDRALKVYESGRKLGTFGLSQALGCTHAEAIACVGELRLSGRIRNYGEAYRAVVPHRERREAA